MNDRTYAYDAPCPRVKCLCGRVHPLEDPGRKERPTKAERAEGWAALYLAVVEAQGAPQTVRVLVRRADEGTYGRAWLVRVETPEARPPLPLARRSEWEAALGSVLDECARWQWSLVSLRRGEGPR